MAELALKRLRDQYRREFVTPMDAGCGNMRFVPTGLPSLERALGVGGLPEGRIIELYGREACGKSTLALQLVAQTQRAGGLAAYIDADHTFEVAYAQALGVDTNALMVFQPSCAECAFEIATVRRAFPL